MITNVFNCVFGYDSLVLWYDEPYDIMVLNKCEYMWNCECNDEYDASIVAVCELCECMRVCSCICWDFMGKYQKI